jgi:hypothetical protein
MTDLVERPSQGDFRDQTMMRSGVRSTPVPDVDDSGQGRVRCGLPVIQTLAPPSGCMARLSLHDRLLILRLGNLAALKHFQL